MYKQQQFDLEPVLISAEGDAELWYYHRVVWMDMDNDGDKDALTARARAAGGN